MVKTPKGLGFRGSLRNNYLNSSSTYDRLCRLAIHSLSLRSACDYRKIRVKVAKELLMRTDVLDRFVLSERRIEPLVRESHEYRSQYLKSDNTRWLRDYCTIYIRRQQEKRKYIASNCSALSLIIVGDEESRGKFPNNLGCPIFTPGEVLEYKKEDLYGPGFEIIFIDKSPKIDMKVVYRKIGDFSVDQTYIIFSEL